MFSFVFAVCFMMIAGVMLWRVLKSSASRAKRAVVGVLTASVLLSALSCFAVRLLDDANTHNHAQLLHLLLFSQIAISLSLVFTFTLLEFITLGVFEKLGCTCCPHGYLPSSKQVGATTLVAAINRLTARSSSCCCWAPSSRAACSDCCSAC